MTCLSYSIHYKSHNNVVYSVNINCLVSEVRRSVLVNGVEPRLKDNYPLMRH